MKVDSDEKGLSDDWAKPPEKKLAKATCQHLITLHDEGVISTQTLCENLGLDCNKVWKEMVKQGLMDKGGNFSSPKVVQAIVNMSERVEKEELKPFSWGDYDVPPLAYSSFSGCVGVSGSAGPFGSSLGYGYSGAVGTPPKKEKKAEKKEAKQLPPPPEPIDENLTGFDRWDYIL